MSKKPCHAMAIPMDDVMSFGNGMFQAGENSASVLAASGEVLSGSTVTSCMISEISNQNGNAKMPNLQTH